MLLCSHIIEPRSEKTGLRGFRPGPTQTGLCSHRRWLEACNFGFSKTKDCTIYVAKTKALIRFPVTAKLICVFVFAYAKSRFSQDEAHIYCLSLKEAYECYFHVQLSKFQTDFHLTSCLHAHLI